MLPSNFDHEFAGCKPNLELDRRPINNLANDGELERAVHVLALDRQMDLRARRPPYLAVQLAGSEALGWHAVHVGNNVAHADAGLGGGRAIEHPGKASPAIFRVELNPNAASGIFGKPLPVTRTRCKSKIVCADIVSERFGINGHRLRRHREDGLLGDKYRAICQIAESGAVRIAGVYLNHLYRDQLLGRIDPEKGAPELRPR